MPIRTIRRQNPISSFAIFAGLLFVSLPFAFVSVAPADDWPMWRFDATRSAASPNELPKEFNLIWKQSFSQRQQAWDDPLNLDLMQYDRQFEPIIIDGRLMVGFNDQNKLVAFDTDTGEKLWTAFAEAPVRLPPAGWKDRVFFCSDDGFLYCVSIDTGKLLWKFRGAPSALHALGNRRLVSAWPARGGPVVRDDTVYFATSIWPLMGTFIYALDPDSGKIQWINDSTGSQFIKQPHSAPSFAGVAPQGALVATKDLLIVPGGRSVPAAFNRVDGEFRYFEINAGGKGTGGSFVSADEKYFYVHTRRKGTRAFKLSDGVKTAFMPNEPVLHEGIVYSADAAKPLVRAYGTDQKVIWEIEADGARDLVLADNHLVAAGNDAITIIEISTDKKSAKTVHQFPIEASIERLIVADKKLFAVTIDGQILAFGEGNPVKSRSSKQHKNSFTATKASKQVISGLLAAGDAEGYALWFGNSQSNLAQTLASESPFVQLAIVDPNADSVDELRRRLDDQNLGGQITVHEGKPDSFMAPQYIANMMFVECDRTTDDLVIQTLYQSVRPYGGVMHLLGSNNDRKALADKIRLMKLERAEVSIGDHSVVVKRVGALPGSADWTHQYGDVANTVKSNDRRVKLPLGVLWFGGSSNMDVLPRHGHGPPEQVVGGRLFIQGMNCLSARDVYTGRILWKRDFKDLGTFDVFYDKTYTNTPLDPKYNQVHIPGANGRGTNYVVTEDRVYLVEGNVCHVLDPASGKTITDIRLPGDDSGQTRQWGYIGVYKDVLIGGIGFANYRRRHDLKFPNEKDLSANKAGFASKSFDRAASMALVGFDRHSGKLLWQAKANHSFWHNGIVAGGDRIYCLDRNPSKIEAAMQRRGIPRPDTYRILALDYRSGAKQWERNEDIFGTWLSYSPKYDLLLQAGASASDRLSGETAQGMAVYFANTGKIRWKNDSRKYSGPCILHNDWILTNANSYSDNAGAFNLLDGTQKMVANPVTGLMQPWKLTRAYGCNNIIACENFLTFRSGAAGFYDLLSESGTGNLGGFKSGCTSNLVVANGVLNAPDYTRTCSCSYQNQTSLALVHMPDVELWTVNSAASYKAPGERIESVGMNFGAPGDRRDANGQLWLEYPVNAGESPPISLEFNKEAKYFQQHSSSLTGELLPWVTASGVENVTDLNIRLMLNDDSELKKGIVITAANDDAEENENGKVDLDSSDLEMIQESGRQQVGLRFNKIKLNRDAVIRSAHIQFTCDEPTKASTHLIITGEATGNAKPFSKDDHDLSSRDLIKTEVDWAPKPWPKAGVSTEIHRTPNLAPIIEAVIRRKDWKPGNSIAFHITGEGKRIAAAWAKGKKTAAKLFVDADNTASLEKSTEPKSYRLRLLFALPNLLDDDRVFDVFAQGKRILKDVTLKPSKGQRVAEHLTEDISIRNELHLRFVPKKGKPVLCGIELTRQKHE